MDGKMRLISLLIFIGCTMPNQPQLSLLNKKHLAGFSSASTIELYKNRLYVIGDDSRYLATLDDEYTIIDSVILFPGEGLRIPKKEKADLEASAIIEYNGHEYLLAAGSASTPERELFYLFLLSDPQKYERVDAHHFYQMLKNNGLSIINIEGLATVGDHLVFANRANLGQRDNHLIIVPANFLEHPLKTQPEILTVKFPDDDTLVKGISGLTYVPAIDLLLFTASVEHTESAYDDGDIGNSYLGYVTAFSEKMKNPVVMPDTLINLSAMREEFMNEKIESVCAESAGNELILHLVADNDDGTSTLFKLSMPIPAR